MRTIKKAAPTAGNIASSFEQFLDWYNVKFVSDETKPRI